MALNTKIFIGSTLIGLLALAVFTFMSPWPAPAKPTAKPQPPTAKQQPKPEPVQKIPWAGYILVRSCPDGKMVVRMKNDKTLATWVPAGEDVDNKGFWLEVESAEAVCPSAPNAK